MAQIVISPVATGGGGGGTISGSISTTQVAFGSGIDEIIGSDDLIWNGTTLITGPAVNTLDPLLQGFYFAGVGPFVTTMNGAVDDAPWIGHLVLAQQKNDGADVTGQYVVALFENSAMSNDGTLIGIATDIYVDASDLNPFTQTGNEVTMHTINQGAGDLSAFYTFYTQEGDGPSGDIVYFHGRPISVTGMGSVTNHYGIYLNTPDASPTGIIQSIKIDTIDSLTTPIKQAINYADLFVVNSSGSVDLVTTGVRLSGSDGVLTILGLGNGNDENLTLDFDNATANTVNLASGTGVNYFNWNSINHRITSGTVTASTPIIDATQTWNNAGVTFDGILVNYTNTASNAASKLINLQVGGSSVFSADRSSRISTGATMILNAASNDTAAVSLGVQIGSAGSFKWDSATTPDGSGSDLFLLRDAANVLAQRNATTAQSHRVYETFINDNNYERGAINLASDTMTLAWETAGLGSDNGNVALSPSGTGTVQVALSGHLIGTGTAPTVGGSCGSGPSIVGTDMGGKVTTGSVAPTSCTVTFARSFTNAPACTANNETTANFTRATSTTTTVILTGTMVAGDVLTWTCFGY